MELLYFCTPKHFSMQYNQYLLSNGLRIIHSYGHSKVAYCGFAINAGTRDEAAGQQGIAHFVEHLLFKGTLKRRAWHILNRMENVGGDLNAYTNKEETIVYSAFLKEHFSRAVELLVDIVFQSVFPAHEIEKEIDVIMDEIQSYEDTPSELIFDDFEELLFAGHPLGNNILGDPALLKNLRSRDAKAFTSFFYKPENMVFFVLGDIDIRRVAALLQKYMAGMEFPAFNYKRTPPLPYLPQNKIIMRDTHQAHVLLGSRSYPAGNDKRTALYLLNNLLGGPGMNSRLNLSLRERRGLVYQVESTLVSYTDTGFFGIYFGTDPKNINKCLSLVHKELKVLRETKFSSTRLDAAKKQLIGQIGVASDNNENNALEMGKSFLHFNKYEPREALFRRIASVTPELLLEVANEILEEDNLSTLIYK